MARTANIRRHSPRGSSGSSVKSPDGIKTTKRTERFDIRDYGANMSGIDYFCTWSTSGGTTTITTKDSSGNPVAHDFAVDEYLYLANSGAACALAAPALTFAGTPWGYVTQGTSLAVRFTVTDDANDQITTTADNFATANPVRVFGPGTLPTGLTTELGYFVRRVSASVYSFHPTAADATGNTNKIAISGGSGPIFIDTAYTFTITDDPNDVITTSSALPCVTAQPVWVFATTTLPTGLSASTTYYVRRVTSTTFTFHPTALDATNNTNKIAITGGTGIFTIYGHTAFEYTARCQDGKNGWTAATSAMATFGWALSSSELVYNDVHVPIALDSHSMALYGRGTSSRQLLRIMEASAIRADGSNIGPTNSGPSSFNTPIETSGGSTKLRIQNVSSTHGVRVGDVVAVAFYSSGDTGFTGHYLVEAVGSTTIDFVAGSWNAGMTSGTGVFETAAVEYRDYGPDVTLQPNSYLSLRTNPDMDWHADRAYPMSDLILDSAGSRLWRVWEQEPDRFSGSVEPTWTAAANTYIQDNANLLRREIEFVPMNDTDGATLQATWTQVASVPTASTLTTVTAASGNNATNKLYLMHNNATPMRDAVAAAMTFGGGEIWVPGGINNVIVPDTTDTRFWTMYAHTIQPQHAICNLSLGVEQRRPIGISVKASPSAITRVLCTSGRDRSEQVKTATQTRTTVKSLFNFGSRRVKLRGGIWKYEPFAGGITEHLQLSAYDTGLTFMSQGWVSGAVPQTPGYNAAVHQATIYFPTFLAHIPITAADGRRSIKFQIRDSWIHYGGGDGNGFGIPAGEFEFVGGGIQLERVWGSHGFYLNQPGSVINLHDFIMRYVGNGGKNCVQSRGTTGDTTLNDINISNVYFDRCVGPVRIGDSATSNRIIGVTISNLRGRVDVRIAEARGVSITGGDYGRIYVEEDTDDLKIANLSCDILDLNSTDRLDRFKGCGIHIRSTLRCTNLYNSSLTDVTLKDPVDYTTGLNLVSGTYKWVVNPAASNEYYLTLRSTGGDPGVASPAVVWMRDAYVATTAGTVGSLTDGQFGYGSGSWGFNTIVVRLDTASGGGSPNPDSWQYGAVRTGIINNATKGWYFMGAVENCKFTNIEVSQSLPDINPLLLGSATFVTSFLDNEFHNCKIWNTGLPSSGTARLVDFSNGSDAPMVRCDNVKWSKCDFRMLPLAGTSETRQQLRVYFNRGGSMLFEDCNFPTFTTIPSVSSAMMGGARFKRCKFQTNVFTFDVNAAGDTWIHQSGQPDFTITNPVPVTIKAGRTTSALPVCSPTISNDVIYWLSASNNKLYDTEANALSAGATGLFDVTTANGPVEITILDACRTNILTAYEFGGPSNTDAHDECEGNFFRGSPFLIYPQIAANSDNYVTWAMYDEHHLSSDAARDVTGIKAPVNGLRPRQIRLFNAGAFTITLKNATTSTARNQFSLPGAADFALLAKCYATLAYNVLLQKWVLVSNS